MPLPKFDLSLSLLQLGLLAMLPVVGLGCSSGAAAAKHEFPVTFSGGHEIGQRDFGRPVALIAAGLGVEPDVFREAFSGVTPAHGRRPTGAEALKNKAALLKVLGPHGVTNERLDEVSDYYRFQPQRGELWPTKDAQAHAIVVDGKIKEIVITDPGSGYCSTPTASVKGMESADLKVTLAFSQDLSQNGAIAKIEAPRAGTK